MSTVDDVLMVAATVASGLGAGVYFAYQTSVTWALGEIDDDAYVATFQWINRKIVNPWFVAVFLGAPVLAVATVVMYWGERGSLVSLLVTGAVLNIASIAITIAGNIPLNTELDQAGTVSGAAATAVRTRFEARWNRLHLVRTVASVGGFVALAAASVVAGRG